MRPVRQQAASVLGKFSHRPKSPLPKNPRVRLRRSLETPGQTTLAPNALRQAPPKWGRRKTRHPPVVGPKAPRPASRAPMAPAVTGGIHKKNEDTPCATPRAGSTRPRTLASATPNRVYTRVITHDQQQTEEEQASPSVDGVPVMRTAAQHRLPVTSHTSTTRDRRRPSRQRRESDFTQGHRVKRRVEHFLLSRQAAVLCCVGKTRTGESQPRTVRVLRILNPTRA